MEVEDADVGEAVGEAAAVGDGLRVELVRNEEVVVSELDELGLCAACELQPISKRLPHETYMSMLGRAGYGRHVLLEPASLLSDWASITPNSARTSAALHVPHFIVSSSEEVDGEACLGENARD